MEADQLYSDRIDELRKLLTVLAEEKTILIHVGLADIIHTMP
jgi:hypothetical protein